MLFEFAKHFQIYYLFYLHNSFIRDSASHHFPDWEIDAQISYLSRFMQLSAMPLIPAKSWWTLEYRFWPTSFCQCPSSDISSWMLASFQGLLWLSCGMSVSRESTQHWVEPPEAWGNKHQVGQFSTNGGRQTMNKASSFHALSRQFWEAF